MAVVIHILPAGRARDTRLGAEEPRTTQNCIITFDCPVEDQKLDGARIPDEAEHNAHMKQWYTLQSVHHALIPHKEYLMGNPRHDFLALRQF
jgi:hypothetical protein